MAIVVIEVLQQNQPKKSKLFDDRILCCTSVIETIILLCDLHILKIIYQKEAI